MNKMQKLVAILVGIVFAVGQTMITLDEDDAVESKLIFGAIFGFAIAASMIAKPEKVTRRQVTYLMIPILVSFTIWLSFVNPDKALLVATWSVLIIAGNYLFLYFGSGESGSLRQTLGEMKQNKPAHTTPDPIAST